MKICRSLHHLTYRSAGQLVQNMIKSLWHFMAIYQAPAKHLLLTVVQMMVLVGENFHADLNLTIQALFLKGGIAECLWG